MYASLPARKFSASKYLETALAHCICCSLRSGPSANSNCERKVWSRPRDWRRCQCGQANNPGSPEDLLWLS
eukprot:9767969-Alexandrium_andersonii.AAC.1